MKVPALPFGIITFIAALAVTTSAHAQGIHVSIDPQAHSDFLPGLYAPGADLTLELNLPPDLDQAPGLNVQWSFNDIPLSGATGLNLPLPNLTTTHSGNYTVVAHAPGRVSQEWVHTVNVLPLPAEHIDTSFSSQLPVGAQVTHLGPFTTGGDFYVSYTLEGSTDQYTVRLLPDGALDSSFSFPVNGGRILQSFTDDSILVLQPENASEGPQQLLRRTAVGAETLYQTLPPAAGAGLSAFATSDGTVYQILAQRVVRFAADGSIDPTFAFEDTALISVEGLLEDATGRLLVLGYRENNPAQYWWPPYLHTCRRLLADGTVDPSFQVFDQGYQGTLNVFPLPDGSLLSYSRQTRGVEVWKAYNADGVEDTAWLGSTGLDTYGMGVYVDPAHSYIYSRPESRWGKVMENALQRFKITASGLVRDDDFFGGFSSLANQLPLAVSTDDARLVTGRFSAVQGHSTVAIVKILNAPPPAGTLPPCGLIGTRQSLSTVGDTVELTSEVIGSQPISYQWIALDGQPLPADSTSPTLRFPAITAAQYGRYQLRVTNPLGSALSPVITLTAIPSLPTAPVIGEPSIQLDADGRVTVTLSAEFDATGYTTYRWTALNAQPLPEDHRSLQLVLPHFQANQLGSYQLRATTLTGTVWSEVITLTADQFPVRLSNLSGRARQGTSEAALYAGLTLSSVPAEGTPLLLRGIGPTLAEFGLTDPLPDPAIRLRPIGGEVVAQNDNWSDNTSTDTLSATAVSLGAFALMEDSLDAALLESVHGSHFTLELADSTAATGVGLIEVYDANSTISRDAPELINLSLRAHTAPGDDTAVAGFAIRDPLGLGRSIRVLLRVIGPSLANYGVSHPLTDPVLKLHNAAGEVIRTIDDWGDDDDPAGLAATMASVGAFTLSEGSADSAVVLDLAASAYTLTATGKGDDSGIVMLEIYRVP